MLRHYGLTYFRHSHMHFTQLTGLHLSPFSLLLHCPFSKRFKYSVQVFAQSLSSAESLEPGWLSGDVRKGNYLLPPETSNKNTSVCN